VKKLKSVNIFGEAMAESMVSPYESWCIVDLTSRTCSWSRNSLQASLGVETCGCSHRFGLSTLMLVSIFWSRLWSFLLVTVRCSSPASVAPAGTRVSHYPIYSLCCLSMLCIKRLPEKHQLSDRNAQCAAKKDPLKQISLYIVYTVNDMMKDDCVSVVLGMAAASATVTAHMSLLYTSALLAIAVVSPIYGKNEVASCKSFVFTAKHVMWRDQKRMHNSLYVQLYNFTAVLLSCEVIARMTSVNSTRGRI